MKLAPMRHRLSLTQAELAGLIGVSQAAISQYESGQRSPTGAVRAFYERLEAALDAPVVEELVGHRPTTMPAQRWQQVIDPHRVTTLALPVRLDWSPRRAGRWNYHDPTHRRELYRLIIDVGNALDVMTYLDPDELMEWAPSMLVSQAAHPVLERLIGRLAEGAVGGQIR